MAHKDGELLIWISADKGYEGLNKVAAWFKEEYKKDVKVEYPEQLTEKFQQAAASRQGPDIVIWAHDRIGEWAAAGLIDTIEPDSDIIDSIEPLAWDAVKFKGKTYGFPLMLEAVSLIYNKNIFPTPPKTFEEFFAAQKDLSAKGISAISWAYGDVYFTWPLLAAGGGFAFEAQDGGYNPAVTGVANEGSLAGADLVAKLITEKIMPASSTADTAKGAFAQGKLGAIISGAWLWADFDKAGIPYGIAPIPSVNGKAAKPFVGVPAALINASSPNKDLAISFIQDFLLTNKGQELYYSDKPFASPLKSFAETINKDEKMAAYLANAKTGQVMPNIPEMGKFWEAMNTALRNIGSGQEKPADALKNAAKRTIAP